MSFPRTATSGVYVETCRLMKKFYPDCLCIYEPFNCDVLEDIFTKGLHVHDRVGEIVHDYNRLPKHLKELIYENSKWMRKWGFKRNNFLGNYVEVLEELRKLGKPIVLKDVILWVKLHSLVRKYRDTLFIITVRNREHVLNSFLKWYRDRTLKQQLKRKIALARKKPYNIFNPVKLWKHLKSIVKAKETISEDHMLGLGAFYTYFYGQSRLQLKGEKLLKYYFRKDYEMFLSIVSKVEDSENVYVARFDRRLNIEPILDYILQTIRANSLEKNVP